MMTKWHFRNSEFYNFLGGTCPWTPVEFLASSGFRHSNSKKLPPGLHGHDSKKSQNTSSEKSGDRECRQGHFKRETRTALVDKAICQHKTQARRDT